MSDEVSNQPLAEVKPKDAPRQSSSAGVILLQWLTYAFWGWTILSLVWLVFIVISTFATKSNLSEMVPYSIAATMVLLPLSLICDLFYSRYEPARKTGASMVVMVVHAVIFALFGIGMLITGVLTIVQLAIGSSPESYDFEMTWIWTALISTFVYAFAFLRTLNPSPKLHLKRLFPIVMAIVVGGFIVLGFVGPVAKASLTRNDRDITNSLDAVVAGVERHISDKNRLPDSLNGLSMEQRGKSLVERNLVTYKPEGKVTVRQEDYAEQQEYHYQLCVNYKESDQAGRAEYGMTDGKEEYQSSVSTYGHPAGEVCYKLKYEIY